MDEYLQKYLDGSLSDEEAAAFSAALARDPALDAELRDYERILALAASAAHREPPGRFTDGVMARVHAAAASPAASYPPEAAPSFLRGLFGGARSWGLRLAWTAGFAVVFLMGYIVARPGDRPALTGGGASGATGVATVQDAAANGAPVLRLVRLVYVPPESGVENVSVAGTFNGWDPGATTMDRRGDAWVVQMVLPPGSYEYMFIEDGQRWVTDPLAAQTRDDGFGRENAVLDVTM